jgi:uncharacterized membrane protein YphA (DoxX/SURF4 family)
MPARVERETNLVMKNLPTVGRILLAVAILAFGIQHVIYVSRGSGLGPPWTPEYKAVAFLIGVIFIFAGAALAIGRQVRAAAIALSAVTLLRAVGCYAPRLVANIRDPGPWMSAFELLAISGIALILAAEWMEKGPEQAAGRRGVLLLSGRVLFSVSLIVFGIQHLMYGPFIAGLIPAWLPGHLFWAYFVGVAFLASALAIVTGRLASLAATLLGVMFFLWVLILHAPRVAAALHSQNEWTSLVVALAMSGGAFVMAGVLRSESATGI